MRQLPLTLRDLKTNKIPASISSYHKIAAFFLRKMLDVQQVRLRFYSVRTRQFYGNLSANGYFICFEIPYCLVGYFICFEIPKILMVWSVCLRLFANL